MNNDTQILLGAAACLLAGLLGAAAVVWAATASDRAAIAAGYVEQPLPGSQRTIWVKP